MHRGPAAYVLGPPPSRSRDLELEGGVIACHVDYSRTSLARCLHPTSYYTYDNIINIIINHCHVTVLILLMDSTIAALTSWGMGSARVTGIARNSPVPYCNIKIYDPGTGTLATAY